MKRLFFAMLCTLVLTACGNEESTQPKPAEKPKTEETATKPKTEAASKPKPKPAEQSTPAKPAKSTPSKPVEKSAKSSTSSTVFSGEQGVLANDVIMALGDDKKNFDELMDYVTAQDTESVNRMIAEGKAVIHKKGTPITVLKNDVLSVKIKINATGERGWVPYEYVTKK
jgi:outer membrane biosynthesis protein TonB